MTQAGVAIIGAHSRQEIIEGFGQHVSPSKQRFFEALGIDFVLGRREGPYLWDLAGDKRLIDCNCNGGVANLGHRHPDIVRVLAESLDVLDIGNHHLISEGRVALARRLAELAPGDLPYTMFGVSGGEAVDLAIKLARGATKRQKIISARGGYHGHTGLALQAGDDQYRAPFGPQLPEFVHVPFDDVPALEAALDGETAAVLLETIPATSGMPIPAQDYFDRVRRLCDRVGAALIVDEVQAGLGRTGRLWAIEHYGVPPDIMVIGKGLSGGMYPITATCFGERYEAVFRDDPFIHISTFGGSELGCQVALKVLEISSDPAFLAHVREMGLLFAEAFEQLKPRHPALVRLRQRGLMMGIEMTHKDAGLLFTPAAFGCGLMAVYANNDTRIAQLMPPLITDQALAQEIVERVDRTLSIVETELGL
jgi:acetylornithine/succinyldiaminopimelate/putrescine aminotransferase